MPKLAAMGFRAFLVMDNTVARQAMAENGRKWQKKSSPRLFGRKWISACFPPFPYYLDSSFFVQRKGWKQMNETPFFSQGLWIYNNRTVYEWPCWTLHMICEAKLMSTSEFDVWYLKMNGANNKLFCCFQCCDEIQKKQFQYCIEPLLQSWGNSICNL